MEHAATIVIERYQRVHVHWALKMCNALWALGRVQLKKMANARLGRVDYPAGSMQRPMSRAEVAAKFSELTNGQWPAERQARILAIGSGLAEIDDIREFTSLL